MRRFHLALGGLLVVAFVLTGQYMDKALAHLDGMADGPRLLYRSRHIYVLMAALLNLALGSYMQRPDLSLERVLQAIGSAAVAGASVAMVVAFFVDAPNANFQHLNLWWSRGAIYGLAAGTLLHVVARIADTSRGPSDRTSPSRERTDAVAEPSRIGS